jgi:hypothetical protein
MLAAMTAAATLVTYVTGFSNGAAGFAVATVAVLLLRWVKF